jgi:type I restriction enzyme S subunit
VPPLEVQREIVAILDTMERLEAELEAELEARRRQYAYYRDALLTFDEATGLRWIALGDAATVRVGKAPPKGSLMEKGLHPYVNAGSSASGRITEFNTLADTVTIPSRGQGGVGIVGYQSEAFWCGPLCYRIRGLPELLNPRFLFHYLKSIQPAIRSLQQAGGTPALNRKELVLVQVPVLPMDEQQRLVGILDSLHALVNDLSSGLPAEIAARRKQYEYYRDRLLTFEELAA